MASHADFYVGRGDRAEWVGSIGTGADPYSWPAVMFAATEEEYREKLTDSIQTWGGYLPPDRPPWRAGPDTPYVYAFDDGRVYASEFGSPWFEPFKDLDVMLEDMVGPAPTYPLDPRATGR